MPVRSRRTGVLARLRDAARPARAARAVAAIALASSLGAGFAACGNGGEAGAAGAGADAGNAAGDTGDSSDTRDAARSAAADVTVVAVDVDFAVDRFTAPAGEVTIAYRNEGRIRHTLVLEDVEGWERLEVDERGAVDSGSIELPPGEYTLFCDVPGHRRAGMEAVLVVGA